MTHRVSFCLLLVFTCLSFCAFQFLVFFKLEANRTGKKKATHSGQGCPQPPVLLKEIWTLEAETPLR